MIQKLSLLLVTLLCIVANASAKNQSGDNGDGTYSNPISHSDYSDPDVIRVGDDFYMTASSFNYMPGLPILHSKDLVNWELVNHAVREQYPLDHYATPKHSKGIWAPSIRFHNDEFYIYWGDPDFGIFMVKTKDPRGEWSKPHLVMEGKGAGLIDACPLWDGDKAYLVFAWAGSRAGINSVLTMIEMNQEGTAVIGRPVNVFDGHDNHHTVEGPKLYKKDGYYYILAPAGGVETGWQLALRSKDIYGPYEEKVVLEQGSTHINGPHQGAWVEAPDGKSWFLHFQDRGVYGRILHLQPVAWTDGWPIMGEDFNGNGIGEPVTTHKKPVKGGKIITPPVNDDFKDGKPGIQWQWYANPSVKWSAQIRGTDYLRLFAMSKKDEPNLWNVPNILTQKFSYPAFNATTKVKLTTEWETNGKTAGLLMMGQSYAYVGITYKDDAYWVQQVVCRNSDQGNAERVVEEQQLESNEIYLRIKVREPQATCQFEYSEDGKKFHTIGNTFHATRDLWTSATFGVFCVSEADVRMGGYADFDWFKVENK
ncbi:MAG: glycoside hydrolase 43 family protein [Mangrovibacterium sp.]